MKETWTLHEALHGAKNGHFSKGFGASHFGPDTVLGGWEETLVEAHSWLPNVGSLNLLDDRFFHFKFEQTVISFFYLFFYKLQPVFYPSMHEDLLLGVIA